MPAQEPLSWSHCAQLYKGAAHRFVGEFNIALTTCFLRWKFPIYAIARWRHCWPWLFCFASLWVRTSLNFDSFRRTVGKKCLFYKTETILPLLRSKLCSLSFMNIQLVLVSLTQPIHFRRDQLIGQWWPSYVFWSIICAHQFTVFLHEHSFRLFAALIPGFRVCFRFDLLCGSPSAYYILFESWN